MFGARFEDKTWRLCIKFGKTLHGTKFPDGKWKEFKFSSAVKARQCAKLLNNDWNEYYQALLQNAKVTEATANRMVETISRFISA